MGRVRVWFGVGVGAGGGLGVKGSREGVRLRARVGARLRLAP